MNSRRFIDVGCDATGYWMRKERCGESFDEASTSARYGQAGRAMIAGRFESRGRGLEGGGIENPMCERVKDSSQYHLRGVDGAVALKGKRTTAP